MVKSDRPRQPRRIRGKWLALMLAIAVQLAFVGVLVFSVTWQNRKPEAVSAELYAPPVKSAVAEPIPAPVPPPPVPRPVPKPEPKPEPKVEPKPEPRIEKPDPRAADIALKAKQDEDRRKKLEAERREADNKARESREADEKRRIEERRIVEDKRLAEIRERQLRESEALRAQAERETQARVQADRNAQLQAQRSALAAANTKAEDDYTRRIQAKVKGNVIVPSEIAGNPEAIFDVVQLPTGEIIDTTLRKSSGHRAYDDAVQRAILKSSPLPRPDRPELFQRTLTLKFRPTD